MNGQNILSLTEISKTFGSNTIFDNLTIDFEGGRIYGIIGQNGCGKTVLMKCICGLLPIDHGKITLNNVTKTEPPKGTFGVVIETPGFLPQFSGYENLRMLSLLSHSTGKAGIVALLDTLGLANVAKKKVGKYSLGMRQRLGIAQAIMGDSPILLLDEPLNGLDIQGVEDVRTLLKRLRDQGKIILLASHHAEDVHHLCDTVYRIKDGQLKLEEKREELSV